MRDIVSLLAVVFSCSACVTTPPPASVISPVTTAIPADAPECREYTAEATIDGKVQHIVGRACRRDDGSWQVVEGTADRPAQVVAVYQAPPYPYYDPWYWDPPFGFGASFLFVDRHHHFHHHEFHHDGSHHGGMHHH